MTRTSIKNVTAIGVAALFAAGCSGGGGSSATPTTTTTTPNIYGMVTAGSTVSSQSVQGKVSPSFRNKRNSAQTVTGLSGCSVKAYDVMSGSQVGATATTDSNGHYTIDQLDAGSAYKVVADCGSTGKFSSVETSDAQAPTSKTPAVTNPLSSLVAAKVIQAIYDAVSSALNSVSGLSDSVKASIKTTLLQTVVPAISSQVKTAIQEAVNTGAMQEPSATEASSLSTAIAATTETSSTSLSSATTTYETTKSIPPSVTQKFEGAKSDAGAFVACSSTYGGTQDTCTKAIAKLMFNGLSFPIILKTSGGVFGTFTCSDTDSVLAANFQNFTTSSSVNGHALTGACMISSKIQRADRNARADDQNNKGGPTFAESFNMDGVSGDELGYISALGAAMFNGYSYHLSDLDKLVFGFDSTSKAGLNGRLLQMRFSADGPPAAAYLNGSTWTLANHPALASGPWPLFQCIQTDSSGHYSSKSSNFNFWVQSGSCPTGSTGSNGNCTAACSTFDSIIAAVNSNDFTTASVFEKSFGGPIPTESDVADKFDNGRSHLDYNPSGNAYLWVLWDTFPVWEKKTCVNGSGATCTEGSASCTCTRTRPCDTNSSTFNPDLCVASDGQNGSVHTVRVNLTFGSPISDSTNKFVGFKPITSMTKSATGRYYLSPIWDNNGFSGLFNIIDSTTGTYLRDDYSNYRAVKVIVKPNTVNAAKECNSSTHGTMTGCAQGKVFNASMQWGQNGLSYFVPAATAVNYYDTDGTTPITFSFQSNVNVQWQQCSPNQPCSPGKVAYGDWSNMTAIKFGTPTIAGNTISALAASSSGSYYLTPAMSCDSNGCNQSGYYLMNSSGVPFGNGSLSETACDTTLNSGADCVTGLWYCDGTNPCTQRKAYKLSVAALSTLLGSSDLDGDSGNGVTVTWDDNVVNYQIPNAPAKNPVFRCSGQPWFIDGNGDGALNCSADDSTVATGSNDIAFASAGEAQNYIRNNSLANVKLLVNQNGYAYGDPVGAKTLVTTAFKGWLDGNHSLTSTTNLNGLQSLALIFLYFEEGGGGSSGREICSHDSSGARVCLDSSNPNAHYQTNVPIFEGGSANPVMDMNKAFGAALTTFKQQ
ncbi:MAG: hypothetical protein ACXVCN_09710 [Bdellovibrio sp.]